jgi:hypothetical protein
VKYFLQIPHCSSKPWSSYEDIPVPRRIFEMTRELGNSRGVEDEATASMAAGVDTEALQQGQRLPWMALVWSQVRNPQRTVS